MRGEGGEDAPGDAAVAVSFAGTEDGVGLVHHYNDRPQGANGQENPRLLPLGVTDPFGAPEGP